MKTTCEKVVIKIQPEPETTKTAAGLSLPNPNVTDGIEKALVVSSASDEVKSGDTVLVYKGCGTNFTCPTDQERYRVIAPSEIIVIL